MSCGEDEACPEVVVDDYSAEPVAAIQFDGVSTMLNFSHLDESESLEMLPTLWSGFTVSFQAMFEDVSNPAANIFCTSDSTITIWQYADSLSMSLTFVDAAGMTTSAVVATGSILEAYKWDAWTFTCVFSACLPQFWQCNASYPSVPGWLRQNLHMHH